VLAYAKNQNLGLEMPYLSGSTSRRYRPHLIVQVTDGSAVPLI
jgi:type III restriction enzyme